MIFALDVFRRLQHKGNRLVVIFAECTLRLYIGGTRDSNRLLSLSFSSSTRKLNEGSMTEVCVPLLVKGSTCLLCASMVVPIAAGFCRAIGSNAWIPSITLRLTLVSRWL